MVKVIVYIKVIFCSGLAETGCYTTIKTSRTGSNEWTLVNNYKYTNNVGLKLKIGKARKLVAVWLLLDFLWLPFVVIMSLSYVNQ